MMIRILDIAQKDLLQLLRDRKLILFLLIMPVAFTLLLGYATGGFSSGDQRLPVGILDADQSWLSHEYWDLLGASTVIRLEDASFSKLEALEERISQDELAAAIVIPPDYGHHFAQGKPVRVILVVNPVTPAGMAIKSAALTAASRLESAVRAAVVMEQVAGERFPYDYVFLEALSAWQQPPVSVRVLEPAIGGVQGSHNRGIANTAPGMMLQFAIAGLVTAAQILVAERKSRALQRLFTTSASRLQILLGHYLAIFLILLGQMLVLIAFGHFILGVEYLRVPVATLLTALSAALCIAALGLLIGVLARSEEQAVTFALIPMFILAGLGGAWVPLEATGPTFQMIGRLSPVAWAMDGFKNVAVRGLGLESVLLPAAVLAGYALLFFGLAGWRFRAAIK